MFIKYDKYDLLEIFESEPVVIDKDALIFKYQIENTLGFNFSLYFSAYDRSAVITLKYNSIANPIFDIDINKITEIVAINEKLIINCENHKVIAVLFKPNFSLDIDL